MYLYLSLSLYLYLYLYLKPHLTVFIEKSEVVEDVSAEHDVLS